MIILQNFTSQHISCNFRQVLKNDLSGAPDQSAGNDPEALVLNDLPQPRRSALSEYFA